MTSDYPESTYAVLGLVDKLPDSSGYELAAVAGRSLAHFWPLSQTLLYRELERLAGLGWVAATRVEQVRAPGKWTYRATRAGRQALVAWLALPAPAKSTFRSAFLLRLFFTSRMRPTRLRALLQDYRGALQTQYDELKAITDKLAAVATPEARAGWLTALHGLRTAEARLAWTDEVEPLLGAKQS